MGQASGKWSYWFFMWGSVIVRKYEGKCLKGEALKGDGLSLVWSLFNLEFLCIE